MEKMVSTQRRFCSKNCVPNMLKKSLSPLQNVFKDIHIFFIRNGFIRNGYKTGKKVRNSGTVFKKS